MPKDPQVLAEEGFQLPLLIGYTSNEGLLVFDGEEMFINTYKHRSV